ncbi:MFS transporter [Paenibacillus herberti]|nr:MFS transporter [Paenibacillus herberti]
MRSTGPSWAIVPGVIAGIAALAVLSTADNWAWFGAAAVLYGLSFGSVQPSIMAWTVGRALPDRSGAANSAFFIGMDGGIALGSVLLGGVVQLFGYAGIFRYSIVFLLLMLVVLVAGMISRDKKPSAERWRQALYF